MKKDPIKNPTLTYECEKNWNRMTPVEGGRFCESCKHVVHDFMNMSDCELKKFLSEHPRGCGSFNISQLRTDFVKYAAATVIGAASAITINSCAEEMIPVVRMKSNILKETSPCAVPDSLQEKAATKVVRMGRFRF
jgi:hypothetical protein